MCDIWNRLARFDTADGLSRIRLDDELQHEINETFEWDNDYDGGFVYSGDSSIYEGLTVVWRLPEYPKLEDALWNYDGVKDSTYYYCLGFLKALWKYHSRHGDSLRYCTYG